MTVKGIDVSHWQGDIDFKKVAQDPQRIKFVICKATEGVGYVDPRFDEYFLDAKRAGLHVGAYHFARVSKEFGLEKDAQEEAEHFLKTMSQRTLDILPTLDIEWDKRAKGISPQQIVDWVSAFSKTIEKARGQKPMIYTGKNFWRYKLAKTDAFQDHVLWIAQYKRKLSQIPGWDATLWQKTAKARVLGINGNVDMNVLLGDDLTKIMKTKPEESDRMISGPEQKQAIVQPSWLRDLLASFADHFASIPSSSCGHNSLEQG